MLPLIFLLLSNAPTIFASNSNNYFCRGCAVIVEQTWQGTMPILSKFQQSQVAGSSTNKTVDIENLVVRTLCGPKGKREQRFYPKHDLAYTKEIRDTCNQVIDRNAAVISQGIAGTFPPLSKLYVVFSILI